MKERECVFVGVCGCERENERMMTQQKIDICASDNFNLEENKHRNQQHINLQLAGLTYAN